MKFSKKPLWKIIKNWSGKIVKVLNGRTEGNKPIEVTNVKHSMLNKNKNKFALSKVTRANVWSLKGKKFKQLGYKQIILAMPHFWQIISTFLSLCSWFLILFPISPFLQTPNHQGLPHQKQSFFKILSFPHACFLLSLLKLKLFKITSKILLKCQHLDYLMSRKIIVILGPTASGKKRWR